MCKVQVTCYISLMLVIVANGNPLTLPYKNLQCAIDDVTKLEKMNITDFLIENDGFYTPEDFTNAERRMEALGVYVAEMKALKEEIVEKKEVQISKNIVSDIDNIIKNLCDFAKINTEPKCEGCQLKNTQEFLKGLRELLQCMYSSLATVEHH